MRDIRVATVQFQHAPGDKSYNMGRVRHFVADAARSGVEIIAFPEMCLTGYWHTRKLDRDADGRFFNSYVVAMPDGRWAVHRKLHVFVSEFLSAGDSYTVFDT